MFGSPSSSKMFLTDVDFQLRVTCIQNTLSLYLDENMEQKSDVNFRAEKEYKNSREKFSYLIREVVSNAIHAVIIRQSRRDTSYSPQVTVDISSNESLIQIVVSDNGDGFNKHNREYFTHLDRQNPEKSQLKLHPKGQGRLAIIYFSDKATFKSVFRDGDGQLKENTFCYPELGPTLFDLGEADGSNSMADDSSTTITIAINKQQTLGRAKTFFKRFSDVKLLESWFIENFFPFFIENESLSLKIVLNGSSASISKQYIEDNIETISFSSGNGSNDEPLHDYKIWLVKKNDGSKSKSEITCFARHLRAELESGKLEYEIDLDDVYDWLLTSEHFDDSVDPKGDKIQISQVEVDSIQAELTKALDKHFQKQIEKNRKETNKNIELAKKKFHSLSPFLDEQRFVQSKRVAKENEIVGSAIESKGKIEKAYWTDQIDDEEEVGKLLNSSLHIYVDHRRKVLNQFESMIRKFDEEGNNKSELEEHIHDLFMKRGKNLKQSSNINHLHNLWILDDKYSIFTESRPGLSTKNGQSLSDIYFWIDDPKRARELLILELKSTTKAHNAGDKYESMVAQVKRYASTFYKNPEKILNWTVNPDGILYSAIILARETDINRELNSNNIGGRPCKIPFLKSSYFFNETFASGENVTASPKFIEFRIEMYSYEDIHALATERNEVFFNLLNGEMTVESATEDVS